MCGIKTNSYDGLRSHRIVVHENNSNIECPQCESKFNTISHLKDHIAAVHDRVKKFACENCPYKATTQHRLGIHLKNHLKKTKRIWITLQVLPVVLVLVDGLCMCILAEPLPLRLLFDKLWNHANSKYNVCRHNQLWPFWFVNSHSSYIGMIQAWSFPIPVSVHDYEAIVAPLHDKVGVQRDAEVLVVHLKWVRWDLLCYPIVRRWKEAKQQPSRNWSNHQLCCCLVHLHFLT